MGSPRNSTPLSKEITKDPAAVEPSSARDVTEPELAMPMRRTPALGLTSDAAVRARKPTLVSPIPALLAASMGEIREGRTDATPLPIDLRADSTSRVDEGEQRALLFDDDAEYIVEVMDPGKPGK